MMAVLLRLLLLLRRMFLESRRRRRAWMVPRMTMEVASLITPSPNTRLYSSGWRSCEMTCSAATESVAARIAPSAKHSCHLQGRRWRGREDSGSSSS